MESNYPGFTVSLKVTKKSLKSQLWNQTTMVVLYVLDKSYFGNQTTLVGLSDLNYRLNTFFQESGLVVPLNTSVGNSVRLFYIYLRQWKIYAQELPFGSSNLYCRYK